MVNFVVFPFLVPGEFPLRLLILVDHVITVFDIVNPIRGDPLIQSSVKTRVVNVVLYCILGRGLSIKRD